MTKSPAFQFYPLDFLQGSKRMTLAERGAYITLLCEQWDAGSVSAVPGELAKVLSVQRHVADRLWTALKQKFKEGGDHLWRNERLEQERDKQVQRRAALARNGALGGRGKKAKGKLKESKSFHSAKANGKLNESLIRPSLSSSALQDPNKERLDLPLKSPDGGPLRGRFDAFWQEYPKKAAKGAAWRVWERLKPSAEQTSAILAAIRQQRASRQWQAGYIPNPTTWLNGERWSDEPEVQVDRAPMPFFEECAKCGDIHPIDQPCPQQLEPRQAGDQS